MTLFCRYAAVDCYTYVLSEDLTAQLTVTTNRATAGFSIVLDAGKVRLIHGFEIEGVADSMCWI